MFAARLSVIMTFSTWLLVGMLVLEAKAINQGIDANRLQSMAGSRIGMQMALGAAIFGLLSVPLWFVAVFSGVFAMIAGNRNKDKRAVKIGAVGTLLNATLIAIICAGMFSGKFPPSSTKVEEHQMDRAAPRH